MTPQLLSRKRVLTDDFHQPQHLLAEHRTRLVCLGGTPSPRVRCRLAMFTLLTTRASTPRTRPWCVDARRGNYRGPSTRSPAGHRPVRLRLI